MTDTNPAYTYTYTCPAGECCGCRASRDCEGYVNCLLDLLVEVSEYGTSMTLQDRINVVLFERKND